LESRYANLEHSAASRFRKAYKSFFRFGIQDERFNEIKTIFSYFDKDKTGKIDCNDLGMVLRGLGFNVTEKKVDQIINESDENGEGLVDFASLMGILKTYDLRGPELREEDVISHFAVFDRKKDGFIDENEFIEILSQLGEPLAKEDIDSIYREMDVDGDKRINYVKFVRHMLNTSLPPIGLSPWVDDEEEYSSLAKHKSFLQAQKASLKSA
jgi:Ca2+-binding EF-hand superfamily protein